MKKIIEGIFINAFSAMIAFLFIVLSMVDKIILKDDIVNKTPS